MRYGIITTGSRGDIQPFVALALALMEKGHDVTLVASENFREFIAGFGIPFKPIAGNSERLINSPTALKMLEGGNIFKFFYHLQKIGAQTADRSNQDILDACKDLDHLIVSVLPLPIVYSIAEKYHKKLAVVFLSMPPIPTREFPFQALGTKGHPWFNKWSYQLLRLSYTMIRKQVDQFRTKIGLPLTNVLKACLRSEMLAIVAESHELIRRPADWPPNAHVSGFFYLPKKARAAYVQPEGLEAWLAKGEKPVYIGFGSIPIPNQAQFLQALQGVLIEHRVLFCTGWSVIKELPSHPNLFVTKYIDHDWILPQCSAAVIHGGIGTVGAVLRSGTPTIVVSVLADQPVNGKIIEQKKLGCHIPFKKLSPEKLSAALHAVQDPLVIGRCKAVAESIQAENGTDQAVRLLEAYFG